MAVNPLTDAVRSLPPVERELVEQVYAGRRTLAEAAAHLGIPLAAASRALMSALRTMSGLLESGPAGLASA